MLARFAALACLLLPVALEAAERPRVVLTDEALALHRSAFVIDGHNDLPWELRERGDTTFLKFDIAKPQPLLHTDLPRLRKGGVNVQFWSAYVPADTVRTGDSLAKTLEQIDFIHRLAKRYPDDLEMALTVDDIERIRRSGKVASLIGIEGGHSIQNSIGVLRQLYAMGARYMTLTHSDTLAWADSATDEAKNGGLSPFGEEVVREMNRLGMLVDLSHVSVETMQDAFRIAKAPVIFSHSSAYGVAAHPRNVPDDMLRATANNGGVVMVNFFSGFIVPSSAKIMQDVLEARRDLRRQHPQDADYEAALAKWRRERPIEAGTVHDAVDHIEHIIKVAGIDHVGLGSDFDGIVKVPVQLEDVSCFPYITQELLNRGYAAPQIKKVLGENLLRVMRQAEEGARRLQAK